jgi:hypothetical protein
MLQSGIEYRTAILSTIRSAQGKFLLSPVMFVIIHAPVAGSLCGIMHFHSGEPETVGRAGLLGCGFLFNGHGQRGKSRRAVRPADLPENERKCVCPRGQRRQLRVWETDDEQ